MCRIVCAVAAAAMLTCSTAQAANIAAMSGVVRVNQGSGYQTVNGPGPLKPGDLVLVSPGGLVQVSYSCGLTDTILPGAVYTVDDDARKCAQFNAANAPVTVLSEEGGGGAGKYLIIGGGIAAVLGLSLLGKDDKPASP